MKKNDGRTWARKHDLVHEILKLLDLKSDRDMVNLLSLPEATLTKLKEAIKSVKWNP